MRRIHALLWVLALLAAGCATSSVADVRRDVPVDDGEGPLRIGALYPLSGVNEVHAGQEYQGVATAVQLVNADGGVGGRMGGREVELVTRDAPDIDAGWRAGHELTRTERLPIVLGTYSSTVALASSRAVSENGSIYWETGAVADLVITQDLDHVYRVGPSSAVLAGQAVDFLAEEVAPAHDLAPDDLRLAMVYENGPYGSAVGERAAAMASDHGIEVVADLPYDALPQGGEPGDVDFGPIMDRLEEVQPDVLIAATYLPDGVAFREAILQADVDLLAIVGKCAAFFTPEFAEMLDGKASGLFVSDKPQDVGRQGLTSDAAALADRFEAAYRDRWGSAPNVDAYTGFTGAWLLLTEVLPQLDRVELDAFEDAVGHVDLPQGALPNGAGARFATGGHPFAGQNLRALGVVWQWQGDDGILVYPRSFATGEPDHGIAGTGTDR